MNVEPYREWVKKIKEGSRAAETELLKHFTPMVSRSVNLKVRSSKEDQEDVLQECLTGIIISLRKGNYDEKKTAGGLPSYIFGTVKYKILSWLQTRPPPTFSYDPNLTSIVPELIAREDFDRKLRKEEILKLLRLMDHKYKRYMEALKLRYIDGKSLEEIQRLLQVDTKQKVSEMINYAARLLRKSKVTKEFFSILWVVLANSFVTLA